MQAFLLTEIAYPVIKTGSLFQRQGGRYGDIAGNKNIIESMFNKPEVFIHKLKSTVWLKTHPTK
jgi:hypothetical protein